MIDPLHLLGLYDLPICQVNLVHIHSCYYNNLFCLPAILVFKTFLHILFRKPSPLYQWGNQAQRSKIPFEITKLFKW